jgi:hypothetical protein
LRCCILRKEEWLNDVVAEFENDAPLINGHPIKINLEEDRLARHRFIKEGHGSRHVPHFVQSVSQMTRSLQQQPT